MSRDKRYQKLLNDNRWAIVKGIVWKRSNGLCERCKAEGYVTAGVDCHHIVPVESGRTVQEMERLCYDVNNIRLLCVACHIKTHQEMRSHTKEKVKDNKERARRRFLEANDPNYKEEDNDNRRTEETTAMDTQPEDRPLAGSDRPVQQSLQRTGVRELQRREGLGGDAVTGGGDNPTRQVCIRNDRLRVAKRMPLHT